MPGAERPEPDLRPPGWCPQCTAKISRGAVLIEYETVDDMSRMFAECPDCESVVHPESS